VRTQKWITATCVAGGAMLLGIAVNGCHRADGKKTAAAAAAAGKMERPPAMVTAFAAVTQDVPVYLDEIGKTIAVESVAIVPQVGGKIIGAHVDDGAYVKKGQLLFEIDPRPFQASLDSAKATLAQTKAERDLAQIEFNRAQELIKNNALSQLEFDQKKSDVAVADAKIQGAQASIDTAQLNLEYTKIFSPIDGRAGSRWVDPGNIVKANEGTMMIIQRLDPIYAEFTITENDLGTVRKFLALHGLDMSRAEGGLTVLVDVPGDSTKVLTALSSTPAATQPATAPTAGIAPREGKLTFLDNSVQNGSGTVRLRATLPNADRYFWPGQFVNARVVLTIKKNAVLVPAQAQQIGQQGTFVYVVKPDSTAEMRMITPGQRHGDMLVVEKGVEPGEMVVSTGQMLLQPGAKVMITNQAPVAGKSEARNPKSEVNPNG
jgi:multidrug efflux system membrane fusion protein